MKIITVMIHEEKDTEIMDFIEIWSQYESHNVCFMVPFGWR